MAKEAQARIKINELLTTSGWRLLDDPVKGKANVTLESNVKIENNPGDNFEHVETRNGFVDYLLYDANNYPICVLEAKSELKNIIFEKTGTYDTKIYAENSYPLESENVYIVPTTASSSANWFYCPFATFNGLVIRNLISVPISVRSLIYVNNFSFSNANLRNL